jgi:hypothetical protein
VKTEDFLDIDVPELEFVFPPKKPRPAIEVIDLTKREHRESVMCWCEPTTEWLPEADTYHVIHNEPETGKN